MHAIKPAARDCAGARRGPAKRLIYGVKSPSRIGRA